MELCQRSLTEFLLSDENCSVEDILHMAKQTASALQFLHAKCIAHCDIKGENLLLTESHAIKLCDFGLSKNILTANGRTTTVRGTPAYIAPELWKGESHERSGYYKADIYAFGILLNFMLSRAEPNNQLGTSEFKVMVAVTTTGAPFSFPNMHAIVGEHTSLVWS
jgi:serine/threonine protein kinase